MGNHLDTAGSRAEDAQLVESGDVDGVGEVGGVGDACAGSGSEWSE